MNLAAVLKFLHILTAFWVTTGILGRFIALTKAEQSPDIRAVQAVLPVAGVFERAMVIPGSAAVLIAGLLTAWVEGWPILGFLQGGGSNWVLVSLLLFLTLFPIIHFVFVPRGKVFEAALHDAAAQDRITPELRAAFRDPVVRGAHFYEIVLLVVIVALMVLKPF